MNLEQLTSDSSCICSLLLTNQSLESRCMVCVSEVGTVNRYENMTKGSNFRIIAAVILRQQEFTSLPLLPAFRKMKAMGSSY